ncbi:MAG: hypothetical protein PHD40_05705 [Syntrophomonadaceae bacterium]|nr:hypothetical protein [Syntrophomonadaceae bacterium]
MITWQQGNNCYRAILAQLNYLDGVYENKAGLKDLYAELSELAFYIMEQDRARVSRGVDQLKASIDELKAMDTSECNSDIMALFIELQTHLTYLKTEYGA